MKIKGRANKAFEAGSRSDALQQRNSTPVRPSTSKLPASPTTLLSPPRQPLWLFEEGWLVFPQEEHGSQAGSILPATPFSPTPPPLAAWLAPRCILNQSPGGNAITRHHDASTIFYFKLLYVLVPHPWLSHRLSSSPKDPQ